MSKNCPERLRGILNVTKRLFSKKYIIPICTALVITVFSGLIYTKVQATGMSGYGEITDGTDIVKVGADCIYGLLIEEVAAPDAPADPGNPDDGSLPEENPAPAENNSDLYLTDAVLNHALQVYGLASAENKYDPNANYSEYNFDKDDWRLILINKSHSIPDDYKVELGNIYNSWQCDKRVVADVLLMLKDARAAGTGIYIASPYRTSAMQVMLYNNKITKFMNSGMSYLEAYKLAGQAVTIPGTSEHEAGLCFDFLCDQYKSLNEGFFNTKAGQWLNDNAYKYGFIMRYPADKEYITTIEYEPWHYRYVGVEAATVIHDNNLTLEEFWEIYLD